MDAILQIVQHTLQMSCIIYRLCANLQIVSQSLNLQNMQHKMIQINKKSTTYLQIVKCIMLMLITSMFQAAVLNCLFSLTYTVEVKVNNSTIIENTISSTECMQQLCFINIPLHMNSNRNYAVDVYQIYGISRDKTLVSTMLLSKCTYINIMQNSADHKIQ